MGDMTEDFKFLKEKNKERRESNAEKNYKILKDSKLDLEPCAENTVKICNQAFKITFFLPSGKWQAKGKMHNGGAKSFIGWLNKQEEK